MLRTHHIHPTRQRVAICNVLFTRHQHVTAEDLHEALHQSGMQISRATVYNTLKLFVKKGMMREVFTDASKTYFDTNNGHHHHFYNLDSGALIDINSPLTLDPPNEKPPRGTYVENIDVVIRIRNKKS